MIYIQSLKVNYFITVSWLSLTPKTHIVDFRAASFAAKNCIQYINGFQNARLDIGYFKNFSDLLLTSR